MRALHAYRIKSLVILGIWLLTVTFIATVCTSIAQETEERWNQSLLASSFIQQIPLHAQPPSPIINPHNISQLAQLRTLGWGHISDLTWHPNNTAVAIATSTGVWVYDLLPTSSNPVHLVQQNGVTSVAYSANAETIITTSTDQSVAQWNATTGEQIQTLAHTDTTMNAIFIDPETTILSSSMDGSVTIWNIKTGESTPVLSPSQISAIAFSAQDALIAVVNEIEASILQVDRETGRTESILDLQINTDIRAIEFDHQGAMLAMGGGEGLKLWHLNDNTLLPLSPIFSGAVISFAFSSDNALLIYGDTSGNVYRLNISSRQTTKLTQLSNWVTALDFNASNSMLAIGSVDGNVQIWDMVDHTLIADIHYGHGSIVRTAAFSSNEDQLVSGGDDRAVRVWDIESGDELSALQLNSPIQSLHFTPVHDTQVAIMTNNTQVIVWDIAADVIVAQFISSNAFSQPLLLDAAGKLLMIIYRSMTLWDIENVVELANINIDSEWAIYAADDSADGNMIALGTLGYGTLYLWQAPFTDTQPLVLGYQNQPVSAIAFSPTENLLVTAGQNTLKLWNPETQQLLQTVTWENVQSEISDIDFNADGSLLAVSSGNIFRILEVASQAEIATFEANYQGITSVNFSPSGSLIATTGNDGVIQLWGME